MAATMTQIAKEAGVSVAVISRLLRGDPTLRISPERRRQIMRIKESHGGIRSRAHKNKQQKTHTVLTPVNRKFSAGWVTENLQQSQFIQNFEAALKQHGFKLHFSFFNEDDAISYLESLIQSRIQCDGMLILANFIDPHLADLLRIHEFPHISNDSLAERYRVNTIRPHVSDGMRQAIEHLQQLGHRRIGFVGHREHARYPVLIATLTAEHLSLNDGRHCWLPELEADNPKSQWRQIASEAFDNWLTNNTSDATAYICSNDTVAMGVIDAMHKHGLTLGHDLSIVGHDNLEQRNDPPAQAPLLTTIDNPSDLLGRRAADILINQIKHIQTQIVHERLPVNLIIRESTGPCPEA